MLPFFAGLAAGLLHVFSGPDHLAAVTPLAANRRQRQWAIGLQWGAGHSAGVLLIAALLLLLRERLQLDLVSAYSERVVGLSLIALGGWGIWNAWARSSSNRDQPDHNHGRASFAIGTVHGLAGSSHLFGVLPALAFSARTDSVLYLAGFGAGAIAGMTAFAAGIGALTIRFASDARRYRGFLYASSAAALVAGGVWLVGQ